MFDYLFATPYTPRSPSDRSGDLLGWRRLRQRLQRELFQPFTVLTSRRHLAELLLLALRLVSDDRLVFPDKKASLYLRLRHIEILFGLASIAADNIKTIGQLRDAADENPFKVLNIERVQRYLDKYLKKYPTSQPSGVTFCYAKEAGTYIDNLSYGIGPHYMSALRRFKLVDDNRKLETNAEKLLRIKKGDYEQIRTIVSKWLNDKVGVEFEDLKNLKKLVLNDFHIETKQRERAAEWRRYVQQIPEFSDSVFLTLCNSILEQSESTAELRFCAYVVAFSESNESAQKLKECLIKCRTFEVVTALADFLFYCLINFSEGYTRYRDENLVATKNSHSESEKKLSVFIAANRSWLPRIVGQLIEAVKYAESLAIPELCDFPGLRTNKDTIDDEVVRNVLEAILRRHCNIKGSILSMVDFREVDNDLILSRTDRQQEDLGKAQLLQKKLSESVEVPELIRKSDTLDKEALPTRFKADEAWKEFIDGNFLWQTFGTWFGFLKYQWDENATLGDKS